MKKLLLFIILPAFFAGCYGGGTSAGNLKGRTFNEQIAELEREPVPEDYDSLDSSAGALQSDVDRALDVSAQAQRERRGVAPLVESDYIFRVMPDKGTYSFDEYNQVWTDDPKLADYKNTKRLWTKPKAFKPEEVASDSGSEEEFVDEYSYEE